MNAKLEELMYEAGLTAQGSFEDMDKYDQEAILKFAELIVQECVNVLHDNELWSRDVSHVLKEHFGVES